MHSIGFYIKLCFSTFKRNKSTFLPYLIACSTSVGAFFSLLSLTLNPSILKTPGAGSLLVILGLGCVILAIFCAILIFYTNGFLIKRRKKELGLYSILGMSKWNLVILLFFESVFTGLLSLVIGFLGGALLTRLFFLLLLSVLHMPSGLEFLLQPMSFGYTACLFAFIFILVFLYNVLRIHFVNPINLLSAGSKGEKEPRTFWPLTAVGLLSLAAGYVIALVFSRPLEALLMFFLAVLLVILGTYCLFISGSIALLKYLKKRKSFYYTPRHFISTSNMMYRMKQNAAGLATICILSCMVLSVVATTASLYAGTEDSLATHHPHHISVTLHGPTETLSAAAQDAQQFLQDSSVPVKTLQSYVSANTVARTEDNTHFHSVPSSFSLDSVSSIEFMLLDDYNTIENKAETLASGEVLLFGIGSRYRASTFVIDQIPYSVRMLDSLDGVKNGTPDSFISYTVVLPDSAALAAAVEAIEQSPAGNPEASVWCYNLNLDLDAPESEIRDFAARLKEYLTSNGYSFHLASKFDLKTEFYALYGSFLFLGVFLGSLFTLATALIIYYKQVSEGYDDHKRFEILQKVGMSKKEVKRIINSQVKTVFYLPLIVSFIHIAVAFTPISRALIVFGINNNTVFLIATGIVMLLYAFIYTLIYRLTSKSYYKLVQWN